MKFVVFSSVCVSRIKLFENQQNEGWFNDKAGCTQCSTFKIFLLSTQKDFYQYATVCTLKSCIVQATGVYPTIAKPTTSKF